MWGGLPDLALRRGCSLGWRRGGATQREVTGKAEGVGTAWATRIGGSPNAMPTLFGGIGPSTCGERKPRTQGGGGRMGAEQML